MNLGAGQSLAPAPSFRRGPEPAAHAVTGAAPAGGDRNAPRATEVRVQRVRTSSTLAGAVIQVLYTASPLLVSLEQIEQAGQPGRPLEARAGRRQARGGRRAPGVGRPRRRGPARRDLVACRDGPA